MEKRNEPERLTVLKMNAKELRELIDKQLFNIKDAERFFEHLFKIQMLLEDTLKSRDNWRHKHDLLKEKLAQKSQNTQVLNSIESKEL